MWLPGVAALTWREGCVSASEAVSRIPPGAQVFVGTAAGTPRTLVAALEEQAVEHPGIRLIHFLAETGHSGAVLRQRVLYVGSNVADLMASGRVEYVPLSLADAPRLMRRGQVRVDVALVQVSPPDLAGRCSLGVSVDAALEAVRQADMVIAEINPAMPRTGPHSMVPFERFDAIVEVEPVVAEHVDAPAGEVAEQIARYVARLVDDGSTLQVGLGQVPAQVLRYLGSRRDLGIHSDIMTDAMVDLMTSGAITGQRKTMSKGRAVASFALGTRRLYEFIDDNADVVFRPIDDVANQDVVAAQRRMVSITQAESMDLTGQVCAEARTGRPYGGVSAQVDFHRGAARCHDGRAIVCLPALAPDGTSAIRPVLGPNEPVTIPRWDLHWVVTEYGAAYLPGTSLRERAVALIEIAHPDHRDELLAAAATLGLVPAGQRLRSRRAYPVEEEREVELRDGTTVLVRPTRTADAPALQALFYRLRPEDVHTRFFRRLSSLTLAHAEHLASVGYQDEMTFAAVVGGPETGEIVGTASYFLDPETGLADVAYLVHPEWQGKGLGSALHTITMEYARRHGVRGFTADVLTDNEPMMTILRRSPGNLEIVEDGDLYEITLTWPASSR